MASVDPKTMEIIENAVLELAALDYPRVWIGEEGITADELLEWQQDNADNRREVWERMSPDERREVWDEIPEGEREGLREPPQQWSDLPDAVREGLETPLEVEPGEFVGVEGTDAGLRMPEVGINWLDGRWLTGNMPHLLPDHTLAELEREVMFIEAAKRGEVPVEVLCRLEFVSTDELTGEDKLFTSAVTREGMALVYLGPRYRRVPLEQLTPEDVDENLLDALEFFVANSIGLYVIEDSELARRALSERLGE
ncbi:MAG: hypothetical protein M3Q60_01220 [Actinomycetota bacterium]|nr:hypothetical protein [Actinomycetota bacterium]